MVQQRQLHCSIGDIPESTAALQFIGLGATIIIAMDARILRQKIANSVCRFCEFCATFQLVFLWYNCLCTIQSIVACWLRVAIQLTLKSQKLSTNNSKFK